MQFPHQDLNAFYCSDGVPIGYEELRDIETNDRRSLAVSKAAIIEAMQGAEW